MLTTVTIAGTILGAAVLLTLSGILQTIIIWIVTAVGGILSFIASLFVQAMQVDSTQIDSLLGNMVGPGFQHAIIGVSFSIVMLIALWELVRGLISFTSGEDNVIRPSTIALRTFFVGLWIPCSIAVSKMIFDAMSKVFSEMIAAGIAETNGDVFTLLDSAFSSVVIGMNSEWSLQGVDAIGEIVCIITALVIFALVAFNFIRLLMECAVKFSTLIFYVYLAPLAGAFGVSPTTAKITSGWFRTFISTLIMWVLSAWVVFGGLKMLQPPSSGMPLLTWALIAFGYMKAGLQLDSIINQIGGSIARVRGGFLGDALAVMGAARAATPIKNSMAKGMMANAANYNAQATHLAANPGDRKGSQAAGMAARKEASDAMHKNSKSSPGFFYSMNESRKAKQNWRQANEMSEKKEAAYAAEVGAVRTSNAVNQAQRKVDGLQNDIKRGIVAKGESVAAANNLEHARSNQAFASTVSKHPNTAQNQLAKKEASLANVENQIMGNEMAQAMQENPQLREAVSNMGIAMDEKNDAATAAFKEELQEMGGKDAEVALENPEEAIQAARLLDEKDSLQKDVDDMTAIMNGDMTADKLDSNSADAQNALNKAKKNEHKASGKANQAAQELPNANKDLSKAQEQAAVMLAANGGEIPNMSNNPFLNEALLDANIGGMNKSMREQGAVKVSSSVGDGNTLTATFTKADGTTETFKWPAKAMNDIEAHAKNGFKMGGQKLQMDSGIRQPGSAGIYNPNNGDEPKNNNLPEAKANAVAGWKVNEDGSVSEWRFRETGGLSKDGLPLFQATEFDKNGKQIGNSEYYTGAKADTSAKQVAQSVLNQDWGKSSNVLTKKTENGFEPIKTTGNTTVVPGTRMGFTSMGSVVDSNGNAIKIPSKDVPGANMNTNNPLSKNGGNCDIRAFKNDVNEDVRLDAYQGKNPVASVTMSKAEWEHLRETGDYAGAFEHATPIAPATINSDGTASGIVSNGAHNEVPSNNTAPTMHAENIPNDSQPVASNVSNTNNMGATSVMNEEPVAHDAPAAEVENASVSTPISGTYANDVQNEEPVAHDAPAAEVENASVATPTSGTYANDVQNEEPVAHDAPAAEVENASVATPISGTYANDVQNEEPVAHDAPAAEVENASVSTPISGTYANDVQNEEPVAHDAPAAEVENASVATPTSGTYANDVQNEEPVAHDAPAAEVENASVATPTSGTYANDVHVGSEESAITSDVQTPETTPVATNITADVNSAANTPTIDIEEPQHITAEMGGSSIQIPDTDVNVESRGIDVDTVQQEVPTLNVESQNHFEETGSQQSYAAAQNESVNNAQNGQSSYTEANNDTQNNETHYDGYGDNGNSGANNHYSEEPIKEHEYAHAMNNEHQDNVDTAYNPAQQTSQAQTFTADEFKKAVDAAADEKLKNDKLKSTDLDQANLAKAVAKQKHHSSQSDDDEEQKQEDILTYLYLNNQTDDED